MRNSSNKGQKTRSFRYFLIQIMCAEVCSFFFQAVSLFTNSHYYCSVFNSCRDIFFHRWGQITQISGVELVQVTANIVLAIAQ